MAASSDSAGTRRGGVQSLERAFELLEEMADAGGIVTLSQLASSTGLPTPTVHRLMQSLVAGGYVRKEPSHRYALGPRLIRLGEAAGLTLGAHAMPFLRQLAGDVGETANLAVLEGDSVVYLAQAQSRHSMRMFTEVGRRVMPHCTAVGKVLLARLDTEEVLQMVGRTGMPARTEHTLTEPGALLEELERISAQGYAVDDGEQELGVRCVAVAVPRAPTRLALSVSGPSGRVTHERVPEVVPQLRSVAEEMFRPPAPAAGAPPTGG